MKKKWIYIIGWSAALFVATFPSAINGKINFSLLNLTVREACEVYIYPLLMALAVLMADVLYETEQEKSKGNVKHSSTLIICVTGFLFCFLLSLLSSTSMWCWLFFVLAWFFMTMLKFFKTPPIEKTGYSEIRTVPED